MKLYTNKGSFQKNNIHLIAYCIWLICFSLNMAIAGDRSISKPFFSPDSVNESMVRDTSKADVDGPHIFYKGDTSIIKQVFREKGVCYVKMDTLYTSPKGMKITCIINDSIRFTTKIKSSLKNEKPSYPAAEKLIAVSDIEGNYLQLRSFLINNGVMNSGYQWTFGKGHLVLVGDFFDRGLHVTECLWLIYHLEQEAIKSGGYVHFILGNHEIMNMNDDLRYVRNKYLENSVLINEPYNKWYTPDTELGRWLETKNIAEKIGNYMFMHGGFSKELYECKLTMQSINTKSRSYYYRADEVMISKDTCVTVLYSGTASPFWYRGFFDESMDEHLLDTIMRESGVSRIVVGHTLQDDVGYFFNKKVIAIDTHHAKGDSEGLLVEGGKEYRIDSEGKRYLIE